MTDKQIIKDDIDVSKCEYYKEYSAPNEDGDEYNDICECSITDSAFCFDECNSNCYYKQLKRKEQECEKLKKKFNEAKNSKLDLKSFLVGEAVQNEYEQQLDSLKGENVGALKQLEFVRTLNTVQEAEIRNLKQTLAEIKEIAELFCNACLEFEPEKSKNCINCTYCNYNKILQKISECEVEDEN